MNEALLQAADSRINGEEKNGEVYKPPRVITLDFHLTENTGRGGGPDGSYELS